METKTKVLTGVLVVLIVALPVMSNVIADDTNQDELQGSVTPLEERARQFMMQRLSEQVRRQTFALFFRVAEPATVEGSVTVHYRNILVVETTAGERLNLVLPGVWNMGSEVLQLQEIFEEGYLSIGDEVTIEALNGTVTNEKGVTLSVVFGYEIMDESNRNHLYAILPVNIRT